MSTNHTPNYSLCQWEGADKVIRADFNADNAKIDAALAGLSGTLAEKPWKCVIYRESNGGTTSVSQWSTSLVGIDWAAHDIVCLHLFHAGLESYTSNRINLSLGNDEIAEIPVQDLMIVLFPLRNPARHIQGILLCSTPKVFRLEKPFSKLFMLSFDAFSRAPLPGYTFFGLG